MAENKIYDDSKEELIPFTQDEIDEKVKEIFLLNNLTDIVYEGSNISQIANVMTYLIHVLNTNTAANLQETLLPLAQKRKSVLFGARQLGYEPVQKISYIYNLTIKAKKDPNRGQNPGEPGYSDIFEIVIPKYSEFISGNYTYYFLENDIHIKTSNEDIDNSAESSFVNILVKEGNLIKFEDNEALRQRSFNVLDPDGNIVVKQNYLIPFQNVEDNGLEVFLTYIDEDGTEKIREKWEKSDKFLIDSTYSISKNKYVKIQNIMLNMPEIYFEIGGIGPKIRLNTLIEVNVLQSSGKNGKASDSFDIVDSTLSEKISVNNFEVSIIGSDEENNQSIKENAPLFHNSANRLVTAEDYIVMSQRHFTVKYADCWGAEDETNRGRGYAYISAVPERTEREFLSVQYNEEDSDRYNDNISSSDNIFFHLQNMPRHPCYRVPTQGVWDFGSDDSTNNSPYPDKTQFNIGDTWQITFTDTNNDGNMDIIGGDLDGEFVYLNGFLVLSEDLSGNKIFKAYKPYEYYTDTEKEHLLNWYLDKTVDITPLFEYLEPYKILTIKNFYRQPSYVNFDLKVNLITKTFTNSESELNQKVFNVINDYFLNIERFKSKFIKSSLISRIVEEISEINSVNLDYENKISLHPIMFDEKVSKYEPDNHHIYLNLAFPFESFYDNNGNLILEKLPQISHQDLFVDFENFWTQDGSSTPNKSNEVIACAIHNGNDNTAPIVGYYFIRNEYILDIEILLLFSDNGTIKSTINEDSYLPYIDFSAVGKQISGNINEIYFFTDSNYGYLDLKYPRYDNNEYQNFDNVIQGEEIPFASNSIPRLRNVRFL